MANKRQRKKAAKIAVSYKGWQHEPFREKGRKNLKRTGNGNLINEHGVMFTETEKKALVNAVNKLNRKRAKMLKDAATLPRRVGGRDTGDTLASLQSYGQENDFILAKRTKSLQRFTSRKQFEQYMSSLEKANSKDYITERARLYKRNHMQAIKNVFGDDSKDVLMKIRMMKPAEYMKMVQQDEMLEIGYIYDPTEIHAKLNQIRASLGMKLKEEPYNF